MQNIKMRVVAGKYRGRPIYYDLDSKGIRPTKDMVRQGLFNALSFDVKGRVALDLFAGTGALAIEALSRGASFATLVDKNRNALDLIKQNTSYIEEKYEIVNSDFKNFLLKDTTYKYDLIFLDPPYVFDVLEVYKELKSSSLIGEKAIFVLESDKPLNIIEENCKIKTYKYGITYITIIWSNL